VFTTAYHWSLSWARWVQSVPPHPISLRSILLLSSQSGLVISNGLLPYDFPIKTLYVLLVSLIHATCPAHLILLDFIIQIIFGEEYRIEEYILKFILIFRISSWCISFLFSIMIFFQKWGGGGDDWLAPPPAGPNGCHDLFSRMISNNHKYVNQICYKDSTQHWDVFFDTLNKLDS
jgi:hypothetical protein